MLSTVWRLAPSVSRLFVGAICARSAASVFEAGGGASGAALTCASQSTVTKKFRSVCERARRRTTAANANQNPNQKPKPKAAAAGKQMHILARSGACAESQKRSQNFRRFWYWPRFWLARSVRRAENAVFVGRFARARDSHRRASLGLLESLASSNGTPPPRGAGPAGKPPLELILVLAALVVVAAAAPAAAGSGSGSAGIRAARKAIDVFGGANLGGARLAPAHYRLAATGCQCAPRLSPPQDSHLRGDQRPQIKGFCAVTLQLLQEPLFVSKASSHFGTPPTRFLSSHRPFACKRGAASLHLLSEFSLPLN